MPCEFISIGSGNDIEDEVRILDTSLIHLKSRFLTTKLLRKKNC